METRNVIIAVILSVAVVLGYQKFFAPPLPTRQPVAKQPAVTETAPASQDTARGIEPAPVVEKEPPAPDYPVETPLFSATINGRGGVLKSFSLKNYRTSMDKDSGPMQLVDNRPVRDLPLLFSWGIEPDRARIPVLVPVASDRNTLVLSGQMPSGLNYKKTFTFDENSYLFQMRVEVKNTTDTPLQGSPYLSLPGTIHQTKAKNRYLFSGPALLANYGVEQLKVAKLVKKGEKSFTGKITWIAFEDTYFMTAVVPEEMAAGSVRISPDGPAGARLLLYSPAKVLQPGETVAYNFKVFCGPKDMGLLKDADHGLARIIDFGWFGVVARPVLAALKLINKVVHNYGVAIILLTILIKAIFWPITNKGMKSMKKMQKMSPMIAKLKEKYKDDKERQNKEMMQLYKTYKINPLGGCLPMVIQIPVFFALYRVLMMAIELRHAPFALWITDLSAPERLNIGINIPWVGGLPLLTLLMGVSMYLQQKMTPSNPGAGSEMTKYMKFLPVFFTFLFINFASGLVLYFLINNLLSMAQQYFINRAND